MNIFLEEWRPILRYEGLYEASNFGNIRSVDRITIANSRLGKTREMLFKGQMLKQSLHNNGYLSVTLSKDGKAKTKEVHRLVYEAFNGSIPNGMQVNHIDENKTNNALSNLVLMTPIENTNWGSGIERMKKSKGRTTYQYKLDGELVAIYNSTKQAAEINDYDQASISAVARGKESCHTYKGYRWSYKPL